MRVLTDRTDDEISALEERAKTEHNMIDARQQFAHDMVTMLHSAEAADEAQREFQRVVNEGELPSDIPDLHVPPRHPPRGRRRSRRSLSPQRPCAKQERCTPPRSAGRHPHQRRDGRRPALIRFGIETCGCAGEDRQAGLCPRQGGVGSSENPLSRRRVSQK